MNEAWKWLAIIAVGIAIILLMVMNTTVRYIKGINDNSAAIDSSLLEHINAKVYSIVLTSRPVGEFGFLSNYHASHVALIAITNSCDILISVGEFGDVYVRRAQKVGNEWEIEGYGGPLKEVAEYPTRMEVSALAIIKELIRLRRAGFSLLNNNCHHMTCSVIKRFCEYAESDRYLRCLCGKQLIRECLISE